MNPGLDVEAARCPAVVPHLDSWVVSFNGVCITIVNMLGKLVLPGSELIKTLEPVRVGPVGYQTPHFIHGYAIKAQGVIPPFNSAKSGPGISAPQVIQNPAGCGDWVPA